MLTTFHMPPVGFPHETFRAPLLFFAGAFHHLFHVGMLKVACELQQIKWICCLSRRKEVSFPFIIYQIHRKINYYQVVWVLVHKMNSLPVKTRSRVFKIELFRFTLTHKWIMRNIVIFITRLCANKGSSKRLKNLRNRTDYVIGLLKVHWD